MATKTRPPARLTLGTLIPKDQAAGTTHSIGEFILEQIGAGVHPITAAGAAGVTPAEYITWIREGQQVIQRLNAGHDWDLDFTPEQQDMAVFAQQAIRAASEQIARLTVVSEQIARGGLKRTTTRTKQIAAAGQQPQTLETTTTTETMLPDPDMVKWRLEHLEPAVYGKRATLSVTVSDMTDTEALRDTTAELLAAIVAQFAPQAIETTASES